ncbi:MAG: alpha/beta hydrolase, partial [Methylococcales bacterium]|nr:alpha/beta hydrolase [Methylococcales bacterium]
MANSENENFWTAFCRYGSIHRCQPEALSQNQDHRCLLVFVHGLFGDSRKTWRQMPKWVLEHAGLDLTTISFSYPSRPWHRCSIAQAADDLKSWLETEFRGYPHVLFVTHSTGGLVVKTLLVNAANEHQAERSNPNTPTKTDSLWLRTRRVLNISVPHFGGSAVVSRGGKWLYQVYYFCLAPIFSFARFLSQGNRDWGKNQIIPALAWGNPQLLELENDYAAQFKQSRESNEVAPVVQDVGAKSDLSVPYRIEESSQQVFIRGTHKSIKIPKRVDAPIVFICAELLRQYGDNPGLDLVRFALSRISLVNRTLGTEQLISSVATDSAFDQIAPSIPSSMAGTQQEVAERIIATVHRGGLHPRKFLVTGAAGVGKSSVLRHISAKLGLNYLARPGT